MLKVTNEISNDDFINRILDCYENDDDNGVVILWENYQNYELDLTSDIDRLVNYAVAHSYLALKLYEKSLRHIDLRIEYIKRTIGEIELGDQNNHDRDIFYMMKVDTLLNLKYQETELHSTLIEYFLLGGEIQTLKNALIRVRCKLFDIYTKHLSQITLLFYLIFALLRRFKIIEIDRVSYTFYLLAGLILIFYLSFFKSHLKKVIFWILDWPNDKIVDIDS